MFHYVLIVIILNYGVKKHLQLLKIFGTILNLDMPFIWVAKNLQTGFVNIVHVLAFSWILFCNHTLYGCVWTTSQEARITISSI